MKVKKGWMVVQVGLEEEGQSGGQRFEIPINFIYHPLFISLLDRAREVYGYHADGPLKLPCSVDDFLDFRRRVERENSSSSSRNHRLHSQNNCRHSHDHNNFGSHALSFRSC
ncbi:hypothetical protein RND81_04G213300 [Saponaria officinalis]|uniref:Uncharacterized protein n=1 Tax=Saponaria officinalis TaxID=3572 RepID=A0AAW1LN80_SAPOF